MTARTFFNGRNIVFSLVLALVYLLYQTLQSPDSTLSQMLAPQPTALPTVTHAIEKQTNQEVQGVAVNRQQAQVTHVVDGDTIEVMVGNTKEKIRIIGINTPETVDPRRGVECFGREASDFAKQTLGGQTVLLEADPSQSERDKYGRLLRFVFLSDGTDYGKRAIQEGFGYEYTYDLPYKYQTAYKQTQMQAQSNKRGLWADAACT